MRTPLPLLLAAALAPAAAAVDPIDAFSPGPYAVGSWDWDLGTVEVTEPGTGGQGVLEVDHFGTLRYPATRDGELTPGVGGEPRPFLVFAHGRFQVAGFVGTNHLQAAYLLDHLASWGFVVASVNLDVVGQYGIPAAIGPRGELVNHTIDAFAEVELEGVAIDTTRVGLIGHSRGGEGVIAAWELQETPGIIEAIATIAPTDFTEIVVEDVPYLSIYGSKDGDVSNGWPIRVYDRQGDAIEKAFEYVEGANHFWFTETIDFAPETPADIPREVHHDVARTYVSAFIRSRLGPRGPRPFDLLADDPSLFPVTDQAVVHPMYSSPDALVVDDHEDVPPDAATNSLAETVAWQDVLEVAEEDLEVPALTLYHATQGLSLSFEGPAPALLVHALRPQMELGAMRYLSLRALQRHGAPLNTPGQPQDVTIVLVDRGRQLATQPLSDWGTIPWPITHPGPFFPDKSVLRTTRVPLRAFVEANPLLDLTDLELVGLVFDQTASGELRLDDLAFTP